MSLDRTMAIKLMRPRIRRRRAFSELGLSTVDGFHHSIQTVSDSTGEEKKSSADQTAFDMPPFHDDAYFLTDVDQPHASHFPAIAIVRPLSAAF